MAILYLEGNDKISAFKILVQLVVCSNFLSLAIQMKFGSLFAGIGGFDLGFERAGMQCEWQVEIDKHCNQMLAQHWPETERFKDVRKTDGRELPAVDLISGGFPCQDVSVAGNRQGLAGSRSGLWFDFHRILDQHRPAWAIIENVPGLLSSNGGADFAVILQGLEELGYGVAWRILDAQNFGVPQRRRRIFIIGNLGTYRAIEVLFEPESLSGNPAQSKEERQDLAYAVAAGTGGSKFGSGRDRQDTFAITSPLLKTGPMPGGEIRQVVNAIQPKRGGDDDNDAQAGHLIASPLRSRSSPNSNIPGRGGEDDENIVIGFTPGNSADSYGVGAQEDISPPVRGGGAGAKPTVAIEDPGPTSGVRRLMPIECERLQGFPDGWTEGLPDTHRYRTLGNAVCVPVIEWLGHRIMQFADV